MTRIKVRGVPQTPMRIDVPGGIEDIEVMPSGNAVGDTLRWNGTAWASVGQEIDLNDPPAIIVGIFGTNRAVGFSQSQITASNDEAPRYQWTFGSTSILGNGAFSIGPDGAIYIGSTALGGIVRCPLRGSGPLAPYLLLSAPTPIGANVMFAAQSPANGLDSWTLFGKRASGGPDALTRYNAAGVQGSTNPSWNTPDIFPSIGITEFLFDAAGNGWLASSSNNIIRYTNLNAAPPTLTFDVQITGANWPNSRQGLALSSGGNLYSSRYVAGAGDIRMLDAAGIAAIAGAGPSNPVPTAIITSSQLIGAEYLAFDYAENLWVASYDNTRLLRFRAADILTSGAKTPDIVLTGGGMLGDGNATGPTVIRMWTGSGPLR